MNKPNPKVDGFLRKSKLWQEELRTLRAILLDSPLVEEVKWRTPCYTFQNHNVVLIGRFKESCVLHFVKGALLKDTHRILIKPGANSQAASIIRFTDVQQIAKLEPVLRAYIAQAIEIQKAGLKVSFKKNPEPVPEELQSKLVKNSALKKAFFALTPGRQRAYILHFSGAKQSKTRTARVEKWTRHILKGKGLDDE